MKNDFYTKAVLTLIALFLAIIAFQPYVGPIVASAQGRAEVEGMRDIVSSLRDLSRAVEEIRRSGVSIKSSSDGIVVKQGAGVWGGTPWRIRVE
jgi:hypothetical protein